MSDTTYPTIILIAKLYEHMDRNYVTSTTGGGHATNSYHYKGEAVDFGSAAQLNKDQMAAWWNEHPGYLTELIHTRATGWTGWFVKNYRRVIGLITYGPTTLRNHRNHNHVAIATSSKANHLLILRVQQLIGVPADGIMGPVTRAKLHLVQRNAGLVADGVIGPKTVAAIRKMHGWKPA
jgi:peptidoglycan hydrolase-like protein with peptidoglycan-binding domain